MPRSRIVCTRWVNSESGEHHACGRVLEFMETADGRDSHGMCVDCFTAHMTADGFTQEQIEQALRDAGMTN